MYEILIAPHTLLRQKSKALKNVSKEDINLSKIMIKIMKEKPGIGLAANQIGILKQIVTIFFVNEE